MSKHEKSRLMAQRGEMSRESETDRWDINF
jgi:hypothetical protein